MHLGDLKQDQQNVREHNERNLATITTSITETGFGRSLLVDKDGVILAGNATAEALADLDMTDVIVVESDGTRPIVHKRTDLVAGSDIARKAAFYDNRAAEMATWSPEALAALMHDVDVAPVAMTTAEAAALIVTSDREDVTAPSDFASYDSDIDTNYQCPSCGYEWSGKPK